MGPLMFFCGLCFSLINAKSYFIVKWGKNLNKNNNLCIFIKGITLFYQWLGYIVGINLRNFSLSLILHLTPVV